MAGNRPELTLKTSRDVTLTNVGTLRSPVKNIHCFHTCDCTIPASLTPMWKSRHKHVISNTLWRNDNDDTYKYKGIRGPTGLSCWVGRVFFPWLSTIVPKTINHIFYRSKSFILTSQFYSFLPTQGLYFFSNLASAFISESCRRCYHQGHTLIRNALAVPSWLVLWWREYKHQYTADSI